MEEKIGACFILHYITPHSIMFPNIFIVFLKILFDWSCFLGDKVIKVFHLILPILCIKKLQLCVKWVNEDIMDGYFFVIKAIYFHSYSVNVLSTLPL
jgi:hypothetical protein